MMSDAQFQEHVEERFQQVDLRLDVLTNGLDRLNADVSDLKTGLEATNRHMRVLHEDAKADIRNLAECLQAMRGWSGAFKKFARYSKASLARRAARQKSPPADRPVARTFADPKVHLNA